MPDNLIVQSLTRYKKPVSALTETGFDEDAGFDVPKNLTSETGVQALPVQAEVPQQQADSFCKTSLQG